PGTLIAADRTGAVVVEKPRQVAAACMGKIHVRREVARDLAFVADVERVDPRVHVVLVEDTNAREQRERSVRERRRRHNAWPDRRCAAELPEVVAADEDRLLLQT